MPAHGTSFQRIRLRSGTALCGNKLYGLARFVKLYKA